MPEETVASVRRLLASIEKGTSDKERARRTGLLKKLPPSTPVASIMEAAKGSAPLRRAAALAIPDVGGTGRSEALVDLLSDPDPRTRQNAVASVAITPELARTAIEGLKGLVEIELSLRKPTALRDALTALGAARTKEAMGVLLAISPKSFKVIGHRAAWLEALARYKSPRVRKALEPFRVSDLPKERGAAAIGLLRNGRDASLQDLRTSFDDEDFFVAADFARLAHNALGTKFVFNPGQLATLKTWWDKSPADLAKRVKMLRASSP